MQVNFHNCIVICRNFIMQILSSMSLAQLQNFNSRLKMEIKVVNDKGTKVRKIQDFQLFCLL